jgi:hypothetical protein
MVKEEEDKPAQMMAGKEEKEMQMKQGKGMSVNDNPSLESEADNVGKKAANGLQVDVVGKGSGVRLNELESMRWTLHGCHEKKLSLKYKIKEKNGVKCVVFYGIKMTWIDVGDLHPGIGTVDDSGNVTDDREFTGAGQSFPIEIDFYPSEYSVWKNDGTHIAGWPPITGVPKAGIRE